MHHEIAAFNLSDACGENRFPIFPGNSDHLMPKLLPNLSQTQLPKQYYLSRREPELSLSEL